MSKGQQHRTTPAPSVFYQSTPETMKFMLAASTMGAAQALVTPSAFTGVTVSTPRTSAMSARMSLAEYKDELAETAKAIAGPGENPSECEQP